MLIIVSSLQSFVINDRRQQRLETVRSLFNSCYQKTVKNESFGPPPRWFFEDIVGNISQLANWSRWLDIPNILTTNGNEEKEETGEETNGNCDNGFESLPDQANP